MVGCNDDGRLDLQVMRLIAEKDRIEDEIRDLTAVLETNHTDMQEALVDAEGFPRNDIDVYRVRHARHRIICLQNDHKDVMKKIERGIADFYADPALNGQGSSSNSHEPSPSVSNGHSGPDLLGEDDASINTQPFAVVSYVENGSPADLAGLCQNDEIVQFGSVNHHNFRDISQILDIVAHSVSQRVQVKVRREQNVLSVSVTPRPWAQPGLLGCQIRRL